jgi:hypothetical protein
MEQAFASRIGTGALLLQPNHPDAPFDFSRVAAFSDCRLFSDKEFSMNKNVTLASLEAGLSEPFAPKEVKFLPKSPSNTNGKWTCLALPYCDKRTYEDRLNDLVFDDWSTLSPGAYIAGNKLIISVTLVLCGIARTDYGEAFLSSATRNGDMREEENSATEAYSQAFRRACAQFRLGRYLYALPKVRVPYDPTKRAIAFSDEEKLHLTERLYRHVGLLPPEPIRAASSENGVPHTSTTSTSTEEQEHAATPPVEYINERQLAWVRRQLQNDPARIQNVCTHYGVASLEQLTSIQTTSLLNKLLAQTGKGTMRQQAHS